MKNSKLSYQPSKIKQKFLKKKKQQKYTFLYITAALIILSGLSAITYKSFSTSKTITGNLAQDSSPPSPPPGTSLNKNPDELKEKPYAYFDRFKNIIDSLDHKFISSKGSELKKETYNLMKKKLPKIEKIVERINVEFTALVKIIQTHTPLQMTKNIFHSSIFNIFKLFYFVYTELFLLDEDRGYSLFSLPVCIDSGINFVFQQLVFMKVYSVIKDLITNCEDLIKDSIERSFVSKQLPKGSKIYFIINQLWIFYRKEAEVIFMSGNFKVAFSDTYVKMISYILKSAQSLEKFIKLNFYILYSFLFEFDGDGKVTGFSTESFEILGELVKEKEGIKGYMKNLKKYRDGILEKCKDILKNINTDRISVHSRDFYRRFDGVNKECLNSLYDLWEP